uniref:Disease resistance N-terminal domain-containing protein n=1 Tax=Quercus lobata TaxID=97700 RepID=A0A7N2N4N7_QUELO
MAIVEKQVMVVGIDDKEHSTFALDWALKQFFSPFASNPIFRLVIVQAKPPPSVSKPGILYDIAVGIIGKAGNLALIEIVLTWSVNDEITKLGETVSIIKAVLLDAKAKQHNSEAIKLWLKSLKDAMCDALM